MTRRLWALPIIAALAAALLNLSAPSAATEQAMPPAIMAEVLPAGTDTAQVANPVTIVVNNDDSTRAFRIHYQAGSCGGAYKVLQPGTTSEAWVSDVNSMRFYEDARVAVKYRDGRLIKVWGVNVAETSGATRCYVSMTNDRLYEVLSRNGANVGLPQY